MANSSSSKQRVLFVAPFGLGQKTTVWARILPLARTLAAAGHTTAVVIPPWDTPADSGRTWDDAGVSVINIGLAGGLPIQIWRLLRVTQQFKPTLVHIVKPRAHAGIMQWLLWQQRRFSRQRFSRLRFFQNGDVKPLPHIVLDLDDWEQAWAAINHYSPSVARFLAWQEEWGIRHADAITAASHWLVEQAQSYAPATPTLYLPNGVTRPEITEPSSARPDPTELERDNATIANAPKQILFYSRYVEVTPEWLAAFWQALHEQEPTATLVIFGDALDPKRPRTFQQAMQRQAPDAASHVHWQPYDPEQVDQLYRASHCAIFPAIDSPLHAAKCSVRLATTLLRDIPVVASAVGEQAHYGAAGAATLVAAEATPATFAAAVSTVLHENPQQRQQRQQAQARILAIYQWQRLGDELAGFYATALPTTIQDA